MAKILEIFTEHILHDYVDGRLDGEERRGVETLLRHDDRAARKVENFRAQAALTRSALDRLAAQSEWPRSEELARRLAHALNGDDGASS